MTYLYLFTVEYLSSSPRKAPLTSPSTTSNPTSNSNTYFSIRPKAESTKPGKEAKVNLLSYFLSFLPSTSNPSSASYLWSQMPQLQIRVLLPTFDVKCLNSTFNPISKLIYCSLLFYRNSIYISASKGLRTNGFNWSWGGMKLQSKGR